jgi:hypothetical protein
MPLNLMNKSPAFLLLVFLILSQKSMSQVTEIDVINDKPDISALFPEAEAKPYVTVLCSSCHDLTRVIVQKKNYAAWQNSLLNMIGNIVTDEQFNLIVEYLAENFGQSNPINEFPLNINSLPESVLLRLPGSNSDIVSELNNYIKTNGNILSINEVKFLFDSEENWKKVSKLISAE